MRTDNYASSPARRDMPSTQIARHKRTFIRFHDAMNSGDPRVISKTIDEMVAPNVLFHAPVPGGVTGAQALKQTWIVLLRAFPDLHVTVDDLIGESDKVVARNTVSGTHLGEFMGRPPTGRFVSYREIFIVRFAGARIAEIWGVVDVLSVLRQLGLDSF